MYAAALAVGLVASLLPGRTGYATAHATTNATASVTTNATASVTTNATASVTHPAKKAAYAATTVSVMTFNLCGGVCRRGEVRRTATYATNRAISAKATVAFFQEVCYSQYRRIKALMAQRGYSTFYRTNTTSSVCDNHDRRYGTGFGIAMIVKGRATNRVVVSLPTTPGYEKRSLLGATATIGGRRTFVGVVHNSPSVRAGLNKELAVLSSYLNAKAARPVIVGGDFNTTPTNPGILGLYHPNAGGTGRFIELDENRSGGAEPGGQPTFMPKRRKLDYLFASQAHFTSPTATCTKTIMSDHCVYSGRVRTR